MNSPALATGTQNAFLYAPQAAGNCDPGRGHVHSDSGGVRNPGDRRTSLPSASLSRLCSSFWCCPPKVMPEIRIGKLLGVFFLGIVRTGLQNPLRGACPSTASKRRWATYCASNRLLLAIHPPFIRDCYDLESLDNIITRELPKNAASTMPLKTLPEIHGIRGARSPPRPLP